MSILDELRKLSAAEDFFRVLEVPYEPAVLNVVRLHILRRMGEYLRKATSEGDDAVVRGQCRDYLQRAYLDFVESSPLEQRVFKVLKDAVSPPEAPLVQITPNGQD